MVLEWIPKELLDYGLAGVIITFLAGLIVFQQRVINSMRKSYEVLVRESADRAEKAFDATLEQSRQTTAAISELTVLVENLNRKNGWSKAEPAK